MGQERKPLKLELVRGLDPAGRKAGRPRRTWRGFDFKSLKDFKKKVAFEEGPHLKSGSVPTFVGYWPRRELADVAVGTGSGVFRGLGHVSPFARGPVPGWRALSPPTSLSFLV